MGFHDWTIIGGGIHGTHLAIRLFEQLKNHSTSIRIIDPEPTLMGNWKRQTSATKMKFLRSPAVHNLDIDPFSLLKYGSRTSKKKGANFSYPYNRPSLECFNKHCHSLVKSYSLEEKHIQDRVTSIHLNPDHVELKTEKEQTYRSKKIILALGQSQENNTPAWAHKESKNIKHIFSKKFSWADYDGSSEIAVIGGGITAIQAALHAMNLGSKVHIIAPHSLREHQFDSDPGWLGPKYMNSFLKEKSYKKRRHLIKKSRHVGSVPPDLFNKVNSLVHSKKIGFHEGEVIKLDHDSKKIVLFLAKGNKICADRIIIATGFQRIRPGGEMLDQLIKKNNLPIAPCGYPMVDETLAWHPRIYVSGGLSELEIGPVAKNIAGARFAADRIIRTL